MKRRALIIGNPGKSNFCGGVLKDMEGYKNFLLSPVGGAWGSSEIISLREPSLTDVLTYKHLDKVDYSLIIFTGHGEYCPVRESTIIELKEGVELDSASLRAWSPKQTLVLDCCRKIAPSLILESARSVLAKLAESQLDPAKCRALYDKALALAQAGTIVLHSCSIDEVSGDDSEKGGYYSYNLLKVARDWARSTHVGSTYSVIAAHDDAKPLVARLSDDEQHPQEKKPRSGPYSPFAVYA